jgi:carboxyl-terminal processing protease
MLDSALRAYVAGLNDPYTSYLSKEENTHLQNALHDESGISGIGAVVEKRDTYIQISEVIKNSPAYKAGLQPLDRIFFIDSGSTQELSTAEAVALIRGEKGTEVNLFIQREGKDGTTKEFFVEVLRDTINLPSVAAKMLEQ